VTVEKYLYVIEKDTICNFIEEHRKEEKISIEKEKRKDQDPLEAFLKFSLLYISDGKNLYPYRIKGFENDFCKAFFRNIGDQEVHLPFLNRILFLCDMGGTKKLCCHPPSVDVIEKVFIQKWARTSYCIDQAPEVLRELYIRHKGNYSNAKLDEYLSKKEFFKRCIARAVRINPQIELFLRDLANVSSNVEQFYEYAFHLILEKIDQPVEFMDLRITRLMVFIEHLEKVTELERYYLGKGKSIKDVHGAYEIAINTCDYNPAAADTIIGRAHSYSPFYENYTDLNYRGHLFLSSHMNSLGLLGIYSEKNWELDAVEWGKIGIHSISKRKKIKQHVDYHNPRAFEYWRDPQKWYDISRPKEKTVILDLNFPRTIIDSIGLKEGTNNYQICPFEIFLLSQIVPSSSELSEAILTYAKELQDAYYPFFRFIICSKLGISSRFFDELFAKLISTDSELRKHIWLYASKGIETFEHSIHPTLIKTIGRFFDRISYR
jgi:hypothetical protein